MRTSVRGLRDHLSDYLRRAAAGEEVVVTSHNRPLAKLVPVGEKEAAPPLSRNALLIELKTLRNSLAGKRRGEPLSETVIRMRGEERY